MVIRPALARSFACALLASLALTSVASTATGAPRAADYVWRNVTVGGGGFVPGVAFSPVEKGLAYLRSDMGGAYRWDAARQSWIPLQDGMAQSSYFGIESLAFDPTRPDTIYLAAGMYARDPAAVLRSDDRGATWSVFPTPFRMGGNEDGRGLGERLAVDPNAPDILYFGSRHDGLQTSADRGRTWRKVASFPHPGLGTPGPGERTHAGVSFVVVDPASGTPGAPSRTLFAGVADPGARHLFRSDDGGGSWRAVAGEPRADLLPVQARLDSAGVLYVTYADRMGPNGVRDGAVFKLDTRRGVWTDITPEKGPKRPPGGYMGLAIDPARPGVVAVATLSRWKPGDTLWRSTDGGGSWRDLGAASRRDVSASPFLLWGDAEAPVGWWMMGVALDPFDPSFAAYTTGATVYATRDLPAADRGGPTLWRPWTRGIEQTAIITLTSPPAGPQLLSGFGDIGGFAHDDLAATPPRMFTHPVFDNTDVLDYAGQAPAVVVRAGLRHEEPPQLGYSEDFGRSWRPLVPPAADRPAGDVAVSADGKSLLALGPAPAMTRDRGRSWRPIRGLPARVHPVADRVDGRLFYALDLRAGRLLVSDDGGERFAERPTAGLPASLAADLPPSLEQAWPLRAVPGRQGDLWFVSKAGLFHSLDGGRRFARVASDVGVQMLDFGKPPPGRDYPALFAIGWQGDLRAVWRSDDGGESWIRLNDEAHEYGRRFRCLAADPRTFGRVYVGTDGRGVVYGQPAQAN